MEDEMEDAIEGISSIEYYTVSEGGFSAFEYLNVYKRGLEKICENYHYCDGKVVIGLVPKLNYPSNIVSYLKATGLPSYKVLDIAEQYKVLDGQNVLIETYKSWVNQRVRNRILGINGKSPVKAEMCEDMSEKYLNNHLYMVDSDKRLLFYITDMEYYSKTLKYITDCLATNNEREYKYCYYRLKPIDYITEFQTLIFTVQEFLNEFDFLKFIDYYFINGYDDKPFVPKITPPNF